MTISAYPFSLAEVLERSYRLAQGLEGLAKDKVLAAREPDAIDHTVWVIASELLRLLDDGRSAMVRDNASTGATTRRLTPDENEIGQKINPAMRA